MTVRVFSIYLYSAEYDNSDLMIKTCGTNEQVLESQ